MPLLRTETIHGWVCKFYDNDRVMVGTTARRFTMNLPADETTWVATRLRAELIARELATAEELPIDEAGEAAMASKAAAKVRARATKAALKITIKAEAVQARAAAALARAELDVETAPLKRDIAELKLDIAQKKAKVAKVVPVVSRAACTWALGVRSICPKRAHSRPSLSRSCGVPSAERSAVCAPAAERRPMVWPLGVWRWLGRRRGPC